MHSKVEIIDFSSFHTGIATVTFGKFFRTTISFLCCFETELTIIQNSDTNTEINAKTHK